MNEGLRCVGAIRKIGGNGGHLGKRKVTVVVGGDGRGSEGLEGWIEVNVMMLHRCSIAHCSMGARERELVEMGREG